MARPRGLEPVYACMKSMFVKIFYQWAIRTNSPFIFIMAEQEGFEPSRRLPDLYP